MTPMLLFILFLGSMQVFALLADLQVLYHPIDLPLKLLLITMCHKRCMLLRGSEDQET